MRNRKYIFASIVLFIFLLTGCKSYKYEPGRDTLAHFGADAKYQIWRIPPYRLENLETNKIIEPVVQKYYEKGEYAYFVGMKGYTVINLNTGEIKQSKDINSFIENHKDIFNNKNFKKIYDEEFVELTLSIFTTDKNYTFNGGQLYLGYSPSDTVTKDFLYSNKDDVINKTFNEWFANHEDSWINDGMCENLRNYLNEKIPQISIKKLYTDNFSSGNN